MSFMRHLLRFVCLLILFSAQNVRGFPLTPSLVASLPQTKTGVRTQPTTDENTRRTETRLFASKDDNKDSERGGVDVRNAFDFTSNIDAENTSTPPQMNWSLVGKQLQLFSQMALPYYKESKMGRWLLAGVLGLTLLNSGVSVAFSYLGKDFWNTLSSKETTVFYQVLQKYVAALLVGAPVVTFYRYQREQLAVHWREWMTTRTFDLYSQHDVYYQLQQLNDDQKIDNPDQRIQEDVNTFTSVSLSLLITILTSIIDLASFSTILWSIYPQLFGAVLVYAVFGTLMTAFFGKDLVGLQFQQLRAEADLRYILVRLRENAESIAFYGGNDLEGQAVEGRLASLVSNQRKINKTQRNLELFTNSYRYLVQILPVAVVAPRYFAGDIALGVISQSVGAFNHILSDLSIIVNQFEQLSAFSAGIERLSTFYKAIREVDAQRSASDSLLAAAEDRVVAKDEAVSSEARSTEPAPAKTVTPRSTDMIAMNRFTNHFGQGSILSLKNLTLQTPDGQRTLIEGLSLELKEGQHLLIVGNSGAGKSSLLRGIAGLWTKGSGKIARPVDEEVYFLPQRPYCTLGSLRDQLLYPSVESIDIVNRTDTNNPQDGQKIVPRSHWMKDHLPDDDLLEVLRQVDLLSVAERAGDGDALKGLYAVLDWSNRLSLGEQQRLAFGRVLVNRPQLVIVDEATSALDMVAEARMYSLLKNMAQKDLTSANGLSAPGLTYVSVGHRPSLLAYHDQRLRLAGDDGFELESIKKSSLNLPSEIRNL